MTQEKCHQRGLDQEPGRMRYPKTTKGWVETVERPGMQQWHKGPRPATPAKRQNENIEPRRQAAALFEEGEEIVRHQKMELRTAITSRKQWNTRQNLI
jgi:hypothetical protein